LCRHIVLNFIFFLNDVGFRESVWKPSSFINFIEKVVIETVDVEGLSMVRLLIFDGLFQLLEELLDELIGIGRKIVCDEVLLQLSGGLLYKKGNIHVLFLMKFRHFRLYYKNLLFQFNLLS
jgi:hypothetical protein